MSRSAPRLGLALAALALGALGGCSLDLVPPEGGATPTNRCRESAQCPAGSRCLAEEGLCVATPRRAYRVGLVVSPGSDRLGELPEQRVGPFAVDADEQRRDVTLRRPMQVVGDVLWRPEPGAAERHVPAELRFVRPSPWPGGGPVVHAAATSGDPMETGAGPADYRVRLRAGERYDVVVLPTGEAAGRFPPLRFEAVEVPAEGDLWRLDVVYGGEEGRGLRAPWPPRSMRLKLAFEDPGGSGYEALAGLNVRAVSADGGRVVSTVATSDGDGIVELLLSPGAGDVLLRVSAGEERPHFPTITVPPVLLHPAETPLLLLPRPQPVRYVGRVEVAGSGEPVEEATLSFESDSVFDEATRLQGSFRATVRTQDEEGGEEGRFDVVLLPGRYTVRIVPSDEELGVAVHALEVAPPEVPLGPGVGGGRLGPPECGVTARCGQLFEVHRRSHLAGRLRTPQGEPFAGVRIEGRALGRPLPEAGELEPASPFNRPTSAVSDGTGRFALPLDVGLYDVRLEPPAGSRYAPVLWPSLPVAVAGGELRADAMVEPPAVLRGAVLAPDGSPWPGATVRAYVFVEEDGRQRPLFAAQAQADEQGRYLLALPVEPPRLPELERTEARDARLAPSEAR